jgi:hypothetical protein
MLSFSQLSFLIASLLWTLNLSPTHLLDSLSIFNTRWSAPASASTLLTEQVEPARLTQDSGCVVAPELYTFTFLNLTENSGKKAFSCTTRQVEASNRSDDPILIYVRSAVHDLNRSGYSWSIGFALEGGQSLTSDAMYYSGLGSAGNSQFEYQLPVDMLAIYTTPACVQYTAGFEPPAFALSQTVPLAHPCPGPDGAGGYTSGGAPLPAPAQPAGEQAQAGGESETSAAAPQEPELQGLSVEAMADQLADLVALGLGDQLNQWPGWSQLTENQRQALTAVVERLAVQAEVLRFLESLDQVEQTQPELDPEYLTPFQLQVLEEANRKDILRQQAEQAVRERRQNIERVELVINRERTREVWGDPAVFIFDNLRAAQDTLKAPYDELMRWFGRLKDPDKAATDQVLDYIKKNTGTSMEDAAQEMLRRAVRLANNPALVHYGYYVEQLQTHRASGLSGDKAHQAAMQDLRNVFENPGDDFVQVSGRIGNYWRDSYSEDAKPGGIYDRAFRDLGGSYDPGVSR